MANLSGPREDIPRDLGWATVPVRRLCSMEEPPSLEDVGLGDPQALALDPMGQGHRLAAPAAGVDLDEAEGSRKGGSGEGLPGGHPGADPGGEEAGGLAVAGGVPVPLAGPGVGEAVEEAAGPRGIVGERRRQGEDGDAGGAAEAGEAAVG